MHFVKMEALGNDFILTHGLDENHFLELKPAIRRLCDRRRGIGADGVIFVLPPTNPETDFRMRIFNSDGSEAEMCGNGIRCFHQYCHNECLTTKDALAIETLAGLKTTTHSGEYIRVDMGQPIIEAAAVPTTQITGHAIAVALDGLPTPSPVTAVSMGNPHAVLFVDTLSDELVLGLGPKIEVHPFFPKKTNVEFAVVNSRSDVTMRVWERGCGETLACGTGTCAMVVAGILTKRLDTEVTVHLLGGDLLISWDGDPLHSVFMTGGAKRVFEGNVMVAGVARE